MEPIEIPMSRPSAWNKIDDELQKRYGIKYYRELYDHVQDMSEMFSLIQDNGYYAPIAEISAELNRKANDEKYNLLTA